ncbi:MAG: glycosyltransferase family 9 protein, partial [Myxococcota bacterium]
MRVARAPNHLGDGVMALPALTALARSGPLTIAAPGWGSVLYRDLPATVIPRGRLPRCDAAVLFPPSLRAAWEARCARRRIGTATDHRRWLLTDVVEEGTHRADTYARLVGVLGLSVDGPPRWARRDTDPVADVPADHVGLNPVSVSGEVREWPYFGALARSLDRPVVVYGGPGEEARVRPRAGPHPLRVGLDLPTFAAALSRCALFVSNDSGAAHFARAVGVPTLVVYGSTAWAPAGPVRSG